MSADVLDFACARAERIAIRAADGLATPGELRTLDQDARAYVARRGAPLEPGQRNELEISTMSVRRFLGIGADEPIELTAFTEGKISVAHARSADEHVKLLREGDSMRGCNGLYQLVNGPMDPALLARYESGKWHKGWNGRATDRDIGSLRAIFIDVDPVRPKGISSTDDQLREAWTVSDEVERWFAEVLGDSLPIGHGCSGNGYFTLLALEPIAPTTETTQRIGKLLALVNKKFGTTTVKIDGAVANPARLMPAPGTWKRKGVNTPERPHRMSSFTCRATVRRVPLEALC